MNISYPTASKALAILAFVLAVLAVLGVAATAPLLAIAVLVLCAAVVIA